MAMTPIVPRTGKVSAKVSCVISGLCARSRRGRVTSRASAPRTPRPGSESQQMDREPPFATTIGDGLRDGDAAVTARVDIPQMSLRVAPVGWERLGWHRDDPRDGLPSAMHLAPLHLVQDGSEMVLDEADVERLHVR